MLGRSSPSGIYSEAKKFEFWHISVWLIFYFII